LKAIAQLSDELETWDLHQNSSFFMLIWCAKFEDSSPIDEKVFFLCNEFGFWCVFDENDGKIIHIGSLLTEQSKMKCPPPLLNM
jgi:hypothetical protein